MADDFAQGTVHTARPDMEAASRHRVAYAALAFGYPLALPWLVLRITDVAAPEKLAPTLLIWTVFQAATEFVPRAKSGAGEP